jgi:flagellar motor component MotA
LKFSSLIVQNLKKGSRELVNLLELEAIDAFEERKNQAKKYGEEAGTKMLFPMVGMLVVVMGIIMFPALVSFSM